MTPQGVERLLLEESELFRVQLPELMKEHDGKVALFKGGQLIETYDLPELAFDAGVERFGIEPFFIERITATLASDAPISPNEPASADESSVTREPFADETSDVDELRLAAAERIRVTHRRAGDAAAAKRVTISESGPHFDLVHVEYFDNQVRKFQRCRAAK